MKAIANAIALIIVGMLLISFLALWVVEMLDKVSTLRNYAPWLVSFAGTKNGTQSLMLG